MLAVAQPERVRLAVVVPEKLELEERGLAALPPLEHPGGLRRGALPTTLQLTLCERGGGKPLIEAGLGLDQQGPATEVGQEQLLDGGHATSLPQGLAKLRLD